MRAQKVKFTENEQVLKLGEGLWLKSVGPRKLFSACGKCHFL
jgi:hypothetical protein